MKERRSAHRTQWAAQFAVASELCKRNYQVALTLGNHPAIDLMVISPKGTPFLIDVKGLYKPAFWGVREKPERDNLYYVFALVPDTGSNQFFILTQRQVNEGIGRYRESGLARGRTEQKVALFTGVPWNYVQPFTDWNALPD
ncbi:MAG: hypothetical protein ACRECO_14695 [Xanthobacteraceae bacterium]